jgi:hypothetical protein
LSDDSYCKWFLGNVELIDKYPTISEAIRLKTIFKENPKTKTI